MFVESSISTNKEYMKCTLSLITHNITYNILMMTSRLNAKLRYDGNTNTSGEIWVASPDSRSIAKNTMFRLRLNKCMAGLSSPLKTFFEMSCLFLLRM